MFGNEAHYLRYGYKHGLIHVLKGRIYGLIVLRRYSGIVCVVMRRKMGLIVMRR